MVLPIMTALLALFPVVVADELEPLITIPAKFVVVALASVVRVQFTILSLSAWLVR